jgi:hypothetical protein
MMSELESTLAEIFRRLAALEEQSANVNSVNMGFLLKLLPSLAGVFGSEPFCTWQTADNPLVFGSGLSSSAVGRLLSCAAKTGTDFGGYVVRRYGTKHGAALWRIFERIG